MNTKTDTAKKNILLVSTEDGSFAGMSCLFNTGNSYTVTERDTGETALAELMEHTYDYIISSTVLPDMDGIEFLVRAGSVREKSIRILMTGTAEPERVIRAFNMGINIYFEGLWPD